MRGRLSVTLLLGRENALVPTIAASAAEMLVQSMDATSVIAMSCKWSSRADEFQSVSADAHESVADRCRCALHQIVGATDRFGRADSSARSACRVQCDFCGDRRAHSDAAVCRGEFEVGVGVRTQFVGSMHESGREVMI